MSQTANGQLGVGCSPQVEPALPPNISARSGLFGSSHRKNSWVCSSIWVISRGRRAFSPEMS
jgi:hypothetical protein